MARSISDPDVWASVRLLYLGSGILFLTTVSIGIANAFTDTISRGQILSHFHSGSIGWVTLSIIATALWAVTGRREVGDGYRTVVKAIAYVGLLAVAGYVGAFALAFNGAGPFWLLPLFGIPAGLVIITSMLLVGSQLNKQETLTTPHLLLFGALLVASLGATMGILVGLAHAEVVNVFPDHPEADAVGAHAGPMDMYLALGFAAVVELLVLGGDQGRWSKAGMTQMVLGVASGFLASTSLFVGIGALVPVALLLFLASFVVFFARVGWRALRAPPARHPGLWWGALAFPFYIGLFVYAVFVYFSKGLAPPHFLEVVFVHVTFVAMATNLVLAVQGRFAGPEMPKAAKTGVWLLNAGLLVFIAGELMAERKEGALVMALGVLLALYNVWMALWNLQPHGLKREAEVELP